MTLSLPETSERDRQILSFVAQAGVASTGQLQRLAFPATEHGSTLTAARRARRCLQRLTDAGLLLRLDRLIGGARAGSRSQLYQLATLGRRVLGQSGRGRRYQPTARFISHALAVGELDIGLHEAKRSGQLSRLAVHHEPGCWRPFAAVHGGREILKPDLQVDLDLPNEWNLRWFIEVDMDTEHLPTVLAKCLTYERYWRSGAEDAISDLFPRVLWSVPTDTRAKRIQQSIRGDRRLTPDLFRVTTADAAIAVLLDINNEPQKGGDT